MYSDHSDLRWGLGVFGIDVAAVAGVDHLTHGVCT